MTTGHEPPPERENTASILADLKGAAGETQAMPDLGAGASTSRASKLKVHSQTLVIALVLLASGGALYMMRKQGMGSGVDFNPPRLDYDIDKASKGPSDAQQREILSALARSQDPSQVHAEKIEKNPFELDASATVMHGETITDPAEKQRQAQLMQAQVRQQQLTAALAGVEVGAIMAGNIPLARINGKIVREGEMVADLFMVKEIHDRSVDLEADGKTFTVNMSENAGGPRPPMSPPRR